MKQIKIRIYPDGYVQTETQGIKGKSCEDYIPFFKRLLQSRVIDQMYTEEYYQESVTEETEEIERAQIKL